jgi:hypothetical protein
LTNHIRIAHSSNSTIDSNVCGDTLQGHDGHGTRFLRDASLLNIYYIHDHTTFEHLRQPRLHRKLSARTGHVYYTNISCEGIVDHKSSDLAELAGTATMSGDRKRVSQNTSFQRVYLEDKRILYAILQAKAKHMKQKHSSTEKPLECFCISHQLH